MADSSDTPYPTAFQRFAIHNERANPSPASKEEREVHFFAYETARKSGEKLNWNDERRHPWPKKDRINWVFSRLADLEKEISECKSERERNSLERAREDYNTWMLKECDGQSWSKIAKDRIEQIGIPKQAFYEVSEAFETRVRCDYRRVERRHPGSALYKPEPLRLDYCPNCGFPFQ